MKMRFILLMATTSFMLACAAKKDDGNKTTTQNPVTQGSFGPNSGTPSRVTQGSSQMALDPKPEEGADPSGRRAIGGRGQSQQQRSQAAGPSASAPEAGAHEESIVDQSDADATIFYPESYPFSRTADDYLREFILAKRARNAKSIPQRKADYARAQQVVDLDLRALEDGKQILVLQMKGLSPATVNPPAVVRSQKAAKPKQRRQAQRKQVQAKGKQQQAAKAQAATKAIIPPPMVQSKQQAVSQAQAASQPAKRGPQTVGPITKEINELVLSGQMDSRGLGAMSGRLGALSATAQVSCLDKSKSAICYSKLVQVSFMENGKLSAVDILLRAGGANYDVQFPDGEVSNQKFVDLQVGLKESALNVQSARSLKYVAVSSMEVIKGKVNVVLTMETNGGEIMTLQFPSIKKSEIPQDGVEVEKIADTSRSLTRSAVSTSLLEAMTDVRLIDNDEMGQYTLSIKMDGLEQTKQKAIVLKIKRNIPPTVESLQ